MPTSAIVAENIWWVGLVIYLILRIGPTRQARREPIRVTKSDTLDFVTRKFAQLGAGVIPIVYVITKFPRFASYPFFPPFVVIGTLTMVAGYWCIFRAHRDLGRAFSPTLQIRETHPLVTVGIYRYVRHPMYLGFLLMMCAQAMLLPNWVAGFSGLVGFLTLFATRVLREEKMMLQHFGDEYRNYMARTARLIPGVF